MACDYVLNNGVSLSTPSHGFSWDTGRRPRLFPATNQRRPGVIHWGAKRGDGGWRGRHVAWLPAVKRRGRNRMRLNSFMRIRVRMRPRGAILSLALRSELVKP